MAPARPTPELAPVITMSRGTAEVSAAVSVDCEMTRSMSSSTAIAGSGREDNVARPVSDTCCSSRRRRLIPPDRAGGGRRRPVAIVTHSTRSHPRSSIIDFSRDHRCPRSTEEVLANGVQDEQALDPRIEHPVRRQRPVQPAIDRLEHTRARAVVLPTRKNEPWVAGGRHGVRQRARLAETTDVVANVVRPDIAPRRRNHRRRNLTGPLAQAS